MRHPTFYLTISIMCTCLGMLHADPFPELGIDFPIPENAFHLPPPLPKEPWLQEDLWIESQFLAQWFDANSTSYRLLHLRYQAPTQEFATRRDFYDITPPDFPPNDQEALLDWARVDNLELIARDTYNLVTIYRSGNLYLLRAKTNRYVKFPWFALEVTPSKQMSDAEVKDYLLRVVFPDITRLTERQCKPELEADSFLLRIAQRLTQHAHWPLKQVSNTLLTTDLHAEAAETLFEEYTLQHLPLLRAMQRLVPPLTEDEPPLTFIRFINNASRYAFYTGDREQRTAGVYMPQRKELIIRIRGSLLHSTPTLKHEAFHQYLDAAWRGRATSAWFNEGHAVYFQHVTPELEVERPALYMEMINADPIAAANRLPALLQMSYADFYAGGSQNYALAWAWVYMLRHTAYKETALIIPHYTEAIERGLSPEDATQEALGSLTSDKVINHFRQFWNRDLPKAAQINPLFVH